MLSKILRGAVLATFAVGATVAQADPFGGSNPQPGTLDFNGASEGSYVGTFGITFKTAGKTVYAGQFQGTFDPSDSTDDFFRFFCIDLSRYADGNPLPYVRVEQGTTDSKITTQQAQYLTELYDRHYPKAPVGQAGNFSSSQFGDFVSNGYTNLQQSAAMQLAIWEIWYDPSSPELGSGNFVLNSGDAGTLALAKSYITELTTPNDWTQQYLWTFYEFNTGKFATTNIDVVSQNYISAQYPKSSRDLPLPGTLALLGAGLAGLGLARRKS